jgi:cytochrome P450
VTIQQSARVSVETVPAHVPPGLVVPYDILRVSGPQDDPFEVLRELRAKPPIFYTPVHFSSPVGAWVLTRAEDIRAVLQNPEVFSSKGVSGFSRLLGETWDMIPLELDPPHHTKFRALLNPLFAPKEIAKLAEGVRQSCIALIERAKARPDCDFMRDFGRPFPVLIFLQLMGLPAEDFDRFVVWEDNLLHGGSIEIRIGAAAAIRDYLRELASVRRSNPTGDLVSFAVQAEIDGVKLTDDEILGICYLLFVGGLDTVASSLGFYFRYLASHPEQQQKLREHPEAIPDAVEELLRAYAVVMVSRFAVADTEIGGVSIRKGDCVAIYTSFASADPADFESPEHIDLTRSPNRHIAFSYGPHRCIGSHLARRELVVALEEWVKRVPPFRITPGGEVRMHGGVVFGVDRLPLTWDGQGKSKEGLLF